MGLERILTTAILTGIILRMGTITVITVAPYREGDS
jgi:hypothetical protein